MAIETFTYRQIVMGKLLMVGIATAAMITAIFFSGVALAVDFEAGQVWTYKARLGEESSELTIVGFEKLQDLRIVLVHMDGISLDHYDFGRISNVPVMPFRESLLEGEVRDKVGVVETLSNFQAQYEGWKHDSRWPWSWGPSIADALDELQRAFDRVKKQSNHSSEADASWRRAAQAERYV